MSGPTYTYTPNVPQPAQPFNQTQNPILNNFRAINELIGVNHVTFNTANTYGKHNYLSLEFQNADPATASNEIAIYCKATGSPNAAEIFYRLPNNGTITQLSGNTTPTSTGTSGSGYCTFPNGMMMRWGTQVCSFPSNSGNFVTYSVSPAYKQYFITYGFTPTQTNASWTTNAIRESTLSQLYISTGTVSGSVTYNYLFIGF